MGASSTPNSSRLSALQERKQAIEETLLKRNEELKQLCIQEAELTGIMPAEVPLEPGESPPTFRRRVGTSFQIPQSLISNLNGEDESIRSIELNMQIQAHLAEAALGLAKEPSKSKTLRNKHLTEYNHHKQLYKQFEKKLLQRKAQLTVVEQKQKKKPRPLEEDTSLVMPSNEFYNYLPDEIYKQQQEETNRHQLLVTHSALRPEDTGIYGLSLGAYNTYLERKKLEGTPYYTTYPAFIPSPALSYQHVYTHKGTTYYAPEVHQYAYPVSLIPVKPSYYTNYEEYVTSVFKYPSPAAQTVFVPTPPPPPQPHNMPTSSMNYPMPQEPLVNTPPSNGNVPPKGQFYKREQVRAFPQYSQWNNTQHPFIPDPQQTSGLGGYWKKMESGEMTWCGSLDRRNNKRMPQSKSGDSVSLNAAQAKPTYAEISKNMKLKQTQKLDNRQLVRTHSLGSVGAHTVDHTWLSDDNVSSISDQYSQHRSQGTIKKNKQKGWCESSVDSPNTNSPKPHLKSALPISKSQVDDIPIPNPAINPIRAPTEIPAQSMRSPMMMPPVQFCTNFPDNCTVIEPGHCKPYREESKPFEMSDFYKYSTKFKKTGKESVSTMEEMGRFLNDSINQMQLFPTQNSGKKSDSLGTGSHNPDYQGVKTCYVSSQPPDNHFNNDKTTGATLV